MNGSPMTEIKAKKLLELRLFPNSTLNLGEELVQALGLSLKSSQSLMKLIDLHGSMKISELSINHFVESEELDDDCINEIVSKLETYALNHPTSSNALNNNMNQKRPELAFLESGEAWNIQRLHPLRHTLIFPYNNLLLDMQLIVSMALTVRTTNCLVWFLTNNPGTRLSQFTVGMLIDIPNMGKKSITELVTTVNSMHFENANNQQEEDTSKLNTNRRELLRLIKKLKSNPICKQLVYGDIRFRRYLFPLVGAANDENTPLDILLGEIQAESDSIYLAQSVRIIEELDSLSNEIERVSKLSICSALKEFIAGHYSSNKKNNLEAIYRRFGIGENRQLTLEECGQIAGVTRERIRQIESKILQKIRKLDAKIFIPGLEEALLLLSNSIGLKEEMFPKLLMDAGFANDKVSVDALIQFSELLHYDSKGICTHHAKNGIDYIWKGGLNFENILSTCNKLYHRNGIADSKLILVAMNKENSDENFEIVQSCLRNSESRIPLDDECRWWIPKDFGKIRRNRLINIAKIVLAVTDPINADDLLYAFERSARFRNSSHPSYQGKKQIVSPSRDAVLSFFKQLPDFEVNESLIHSKNKLEPKEIMNAVDLAIYEIGNNSIDGIMNRNQITDGCVRKGIPFGTVSVNTSYSPVLKHLALETFVLIGRTIDPMAKSAHSEVQAGKARRKAVLLSDWKSGKLRIIARVPSQPQSMVVGVPGNIKRFFTSNKYNAIDLEGTTSGVIGIHDRGSAKTLYGMGTFCHRENFRENDLLAMEFDLVNSIVNLSRIEMSEIMDQIE